jgi:tetratricopeptide (TPR) repeat protein
MALPGDFRLKAEVTRVQAQLEDPDQLYAHRDDLSKARAAEKIWADHLARDPKDFESAWKLARTRYWLGGHAAEQDRKTLYEGGIAAGRAAVAVSPNRPEGHFWVAANMGALAESFGTRQGLKYRSDIKNELEIVLKIEPGFQDGSADRALGRWYNKVPDLFGGSDKKAEAHLRKSLTYNPDSTASLYFLAETLLDERKNDEARAVLDKLIAAPLDPDWSPEDREFKDKARQLYTKLR